MSLTIAVTGATGDQGGAAARALLAQGHQVRALTRNVASPAAAALAALGAQLHAADFDDHASLDAALAGADGLFAMTTPFGTDIDTEIKQGFALIDAAATAKIGHVVFTSAAHADRKTHIPHYDSKNQIERHLIASDLPWTIIGPAAFMDNFATGWSLDSLRVATFAWPMPAETPLTLIPAADIGAFAALAFTRRTDFLSQRIDIASDERTAAEQATDLTAAIGRTITHQEVPLDYVRQHSTDLAAMFGYFQTAGLDVDVAGLRRDFPEIGWHRFADWAAAQDWPTLFSTPASHH